MDVRAAVAVSRSTTADHNGDHAFELMKRGEPIRSVVTF